MTQIYDRFGDTLLYEGEGSMKDCVEEAVKHGVSLEGAKLVGADLSQINLEGANLRYADLSRASLFNTNLSNAEMEGVDLSNTFLENTSLKNVNLERAFFASSEIWNSTFEGSNLSWSNFTMSILGPASFKGADLTKVFVVGTVFIGINEVIDAGCDQRGHRFWAWHCTLDNPHVVYRAGCREWHQHEDALYHYNEAYISSGDRADCHLRLVSLYRQASRLGWIS